MTRIERIAPFIEALSDDAFEDFLAAASYAAGEAAIYPTLTPQQKAEIDAAIVRLDAGEGAAVLPERTRGPRAATGVPLRDQLDRAQWAVRLLVRRVHAHMVVLPRAAAIGRPSDRACGKLRSARCGRARRASSAGATTAQ